MLFSLASFNTNAEFLERNSITPLCDAIHADAITRFHTKKSPGQNGRGDDFLSVVKTTQLFQRTVLLIPHNDMVEHVNFYQLTGANQITRDLADA